MCTYTQLTVSMQAYASACMCTHACMYLHTRFGERETRARTLHVHNYLTCACTVFLCSRLHRAAERPEGSARRAGCQKKSVNMQCRLGVDARAARTCSARTCFVSCPRFAEKIDEAEQQFTKGKKRLKAKEARHRNAEGASEFRRGRGCSLQEPLLWLCALRAASSAGRSRSCTCKSDSNSAWVSPVRSEARPPRADARSPAAAAGGGEP